MAIPETSTRQHYHYMAELAERAERYEEMLDNMNKLVATVFSPNEETGHPNKELTWDESNALSAAYKNVIGSRRTAWLTLSQVKEGRKNGDILRGYKAKVEAEISQLCDKILKLLKNYLIPSSESSSVAKVFYLKMEGDYNRYLAEVKVGDDREEPVKNALIAYRAAEKIALTDLAPADPLRLGLLLNFSVFYYQILSAKEMACAIARNAFDEASAELHALDKVPANYKDSNLIMQIIKDNYTFWSFDA